MNPRRPLRLRGSFFHAIAETSLAEFFLVGGATLVLFPLAWLLRAVVGLDRATLGVGFFTFYGAYVVNDPHFAVTYLLFYKHAAKQARSPEVGVAQRVRTLVAGALVPAVLVIWIGAAWWGRSAQSIGWMVQLMFLLVGWHYVKQGFGVLVVLSARRGKLLDARERAVFAAHCFAAWAFAWSRRDLAAGEFEESGVVYWAPARPHVVATIAAAALAATAIGIVAVAVARWRRERTTLPLAPLAGFLITVWSWTIYASSDPVMLFVIPALHSIQYLYFVWLLKRNEARAAEGPPLFGRPTGTRLAILALSAIALGWLVFHGAPGFVDETVVARARAAGSAPDALGPTPFAAAFFAAVNIHHYVMDHVIWRRDNPETRYLRD